MEGASAAATTMAENQSPVTSVEDVTSVKDKELANQVKHKFLHVNLDPKCIHKRVKIDVNMFLMVSANGGDWHGKAQYFPRSLAGEAHWKLFWGRNAREHAYTQIPGTDVYLYTAMKGADPAYNSMLIPRVDEHRVDCSL